MRSARYDFDVVSQGSQIERGVVLDSYRGLKSIFGNHVGRCHPCRVVYYRSVSQ